MSYPIHNASSNVALSVRELTQFIKAHLEEEFPWVRLRGEISNLRLHTSGHLYFTLKDAEAQINAVMWRSYAANLTFEMEDGLEVVVEGPVKVYEPQGRYQIVCNTAQPVGEGYLQKEFLRLYERLKAQGLFDEARKKSLPRYPESIGIITSPTGAVIEDMKTILRRRYRAARLVLYPAQVQGEEAVAQLIAGIQYFHHVTPRPDVLILARGGGSIEDLWAFNSEALAHAIARSEIPIISAVGHETDYTIADYVADYRASTPSMAAEIVARPADEILAEIEHKLNAARDALTNSIQQHYHYLHSLLNSYAFNKPLRDLETLRQRLDDAEAKLHHHFAARLHHARTVLSALMQQLNALSPMQTLQRGYVLVQKNGQHIHSAHTLHAGELLTLHFHDGIVQVYVAPSGTTASNGQPAPAQSIADQSY